MTISVVLSHDYCVHCGKKKKPEGQIKYCHECQIKQEVLRRQKQRELNRNTHERSRALWELVNNNPELSAKIKDIEREIIENRDKVNKNKRAVNNT